VYGPQDEGDKSLFLEELASIRDQCAGPWCIIGDFNLILDDADKNNSRISRRTMAHCAGAGTDGHSSTWPDVHLEQRAGKPDARAAGPRSSNAGLGRALSCMPPPGCQALSTDASDHCPLFLQTNMTFSPKPRFHFEVFWPKFSDYQDALKRGWQCSGNSSDPIRRLDALFKNLASELKSWSARRIGIIKEQLIMAREIILRLDQASDQRQLTQQEAALTERGAQTQMPRRVIAGKNLCAAAVKGAISS